MSVLIKGIELPKNCYECPFAMEYYSTLYTAQRNKFRADYSCVITHKAITSTKRNRFCPLVEIPPHGGLIARDVLLQEIEEYIEEYSAVDEHGLHCEKWCAMKEAEMAINEVPIIIEAEECDNERTE